MDHRELQLLPGDTPTCWKSNSPAEVCGNSMEFSSNGTPDLQLSIGLQTTGPIFSGSPSPFSSNEFGNLRRSGGSEAEAVRRQAEEQRRLASAERAYAERAREMARREIQIAEREFTRARKMREKAHEEIEMAQRMREQATRRVDSSCMEITCHACRQQFRL
ncbi:hypothetical protein AMTRI_Chr06g171990 [Amborella trichopoda]|uniref:Uncharacterized protein n=1 Tax=Amborella trichopoda TaxID=13333 RepID=W1PPD1_AMBTC|nr:protein indeterminate-domain 16 [Amborella trichopoda]ERN09923.1 hypothetical protein AMTR_s00013p00177960 [Amborella trichopoda]|eukprot:XP_020525506.1 protein indeterminate-domain 16 [Amborella trichopoda]